MSQQRNKFASAVAINKICLPILQSYEGRINSLDFHHQEDLLVTAADDNSIVLYDANTGQQRTVSFSKKYGVRNIVFTH